jgi:hypothetical protein
MSPMDQACDNLLKAAELLKLKQCVITVHANKQLVLEADVNVASRSVRYFDKPTDSSASTADEITDADVAAWLVAQAEYQKLQDCTVTIWNRRYPPYGVAFMAEAVIGGKLVRGDGPPTIAGAFADLRRESKTPADIAAEKRAAAEKLLAEANELDPP